MVRIAVSLVIVLGMIVFLGSTFDDSVSYADESELVTDTAQKSRGSGSNENVKSMSNKNDPNTVIPAPANKSGDKSRQGVCCITIDNYTAWKIQIFVDNDYYGLLFPWGNGTSCVYSGATTIFARAQFTNDIDSEWGPRVFNCRPGQEYTWRLDG